MKNKRVPGVKQTTIVKEGETTVEQMAGLISKARTENDAVLQAYHKLWYESEFTWCYTSFLGIGLMKSPNDLWVYQMLMAQLRPTTIIETGTYQGGSALWFAYLMDMLGIADGKIFSVDVEDFRKNKQVLHPRITYIAGDSKNKRVVKSIAKQLKSGPRLICLDSDHSAAHVLAELELYAPLVQVGDWLVVEDTNIAWESDRGARGGLQDYMDKHPGEFRQDILCERYLLTMNPGGWLQRIAPCVH